MAKTKSKNKSKNVKNKSKNAKNKSQSVAIKAKSAKNKVKIGKNRKKLKKNLQTIEKSPKEVLPKILATDKKLLKLKRSLDGPNLSSNKIESTSLRDKMMEKLKSAHFRLLNEEIYINKGETSLKYFKNNPEAFKIYHDGYRQQVSKWPVNPLDIIIQEIRSLPKNLIIADMGCGEAKLSKCVKQKVHSFDLVSSNNPNVTVCDMAKVPLEKESVDLVVFCLSLMGTNLQDFILEANRILRKDGVLKIAEVESRCESVEKFIKEIQQFGFKIISENLKHNLFIFMDFKKEKFVGRNKNKLPNVSLQPCLYKKR